MLPGSRRGAALACLAVTTSVRVPEPELMDDDEQARAYSEADFSVPHQMFVDEFVERFPHLQPRSFRAIDLGCGPADVTCRFAVAHPHARVVGVDGADAMLELGHRRVAELGLDDRIALERRRLPDPMLDASVERARFDAVVSTSLLHHLADPHTLWRTIAGVAAPGAAIFIMDLCRPADDERVDALVASLAADAPDVLRRDFRASLRAAYTVDEVAEQVSASAFDLEVTRITDRHLVAWGFAR